MKETKSSRNIKKENVRRYMERNSLEKMTVYIDKDLYNAFNSICIERGDKKKFFNEAISDFCKKKGVG